MEEIKNMKNGVLSQVDEKFGLLSDEAMQKKYEIIEQRLFEFANFLESQLVLLYTPLTYKIVETSQIIKKTLYIEKGVVLPVFTDAKNSFLLYKITDFKKDLVENQDGILEPDPGRCKKILLDEVDIAIIPGLAFDDKGGRVGFGNNYYAKLITKLPETCRKVSLAYEEQMVDQIQMESRKYTVDIIITDDRVIYKI